MNSPLVDLAEDQRWQKGVEQQMRIDTWAKLHCSTGRQSTVQIDPCGHMGKGELLLHILAVQVLKATWLGSQPICRSYATDLGAAVQPVGQNLWAHLSCLAKRLFRWRWQEMLRSYNIIHYLFVAERK